MALNLFSRFAPRINPATPEYPAGSIKNESVPGARDGTPLDADWGNDYAGFDAALLATAGLTASGTPDTALVSQRLAALQALFVSSSGLANVESLVQIGGVNAKKVAALAGGVVVAAEYLVAPTTATGAIAAAIAAAGSKPVFIGDQFNGLTISGIVLNANQTVFGMGVNLNISANTFAFALDNNSSVKGLNITGSGKASGLTSQTAYLIPSSMGTPISRTKVSDTNIKGMGGSAYRGTYLVNNHEGNVFTNYNIESCNIGIDADSRHEYLNAAVGNISLCNTGVRVQGGNTNLTGVVISDNDIGIDLVAGSNDAHGQVIGALLNHNITRTIKVDGTANGFLFSGCQIFNGGAIELKSCNDVWFRGCVKHAVQVIEDGAVRCGFTNSDLLDGIDNVPNANGNPSEVFYLDNRLPAATSLTGINGLNGGLLRLQVNTNIATIPTGANDFEWPIIISNAITGNLNYTVQQFYAAGNPFIRGDVRAVRGSAFLNIDSQMTFGKAVGAAWTADQVRVYLLNSSGDIVGRMTPETQASTGASNTITYSINGSIARGAVKFVIENNSGGNMILFRQQNGTPIQTYCNVTGW